MEVEKKALTNKLEIVKEDYTTLRLAQMASKNNRESYNMRDANFKENAIELIHENKTLKELLRTQEQKHLTERINWQQEGYLGDTYEQ